MYQPSFSTILIVEQNPSLGEILKETLKGNYRVFVKTDTVAAFTFLFQGNLPDLIIIDFNRDELGVREFLFELQQNRFFAQIPLLLLGNDYLLTKAKLENIPSIRHLINKPFNPQKILDYTEKILQTNEHQP
jgi:CheY-like chemotaxis protein